MCPYHGRATNELRSVLKLISYQSHASRITCHSSRHKCTGYQTLFTLEGFQAQNGLLCVVLYKSDQRPCNVRVAMSAQIASSQRYSNAHEKNCPCYQCRARSLRRQKISVLTPRPTSAMCANALKAPGAGTMRSFLYTMRLSSRGHDMRNVHHLSISVLNFQFPALR